MGKLSTKYSFISIQFLRKRLRNMIQQVLTNFMHYVRYVAKKILYFNI
ncbi:UNVERIFIED_CONTAM: hypothetical protein NCL1_33350 [Trichonephila clavipes]